MEKDIRWLQRFSNYVKAYNKFSDGIRYAREHFVNDELTISEAVLEEIIKEGLIQRFEYTHELGWNVMKDYAEYQGNFEIKGSRDATQEAFKMKLISNGEVWMDMIKSRNRTAHTYNKETANEIYSTIIEDYSIAFQDFLDNMEKLRIGYQKDLFDQ